MGMQIIGGPMYAALFDAKATTYFRMAVPNFFALAASACLYGCLFNPFFGIIQIAKKACDELEEEREAAKLGKFVWTAAGIKAVESNKESFKDAKVGSSFGHKELTTWRQTEPKATFDSICGQKLIERSAEPAKTSEDKKAD